MTANTPSQKHIDTPAESLATLSDQQLSEIYQCSVWSSVCVEDDATAQTEWTKANGASAELRRRTFARIEASKQDLEV